MSELYRPTSENVVTPVVSPELGEGTMADVQIVQAPVISLDLPFPPGQKDGEKVISVVFIPSHRVIFETPFQEFRRLVTENRTHGLGVDANLQRAEASDAQKDPTELLRERLQRTTHYEAMTDALVLMQRSLRDDPERTIVLKEVGAKVGLTSHRMSELYQRARSVGIPLPFYRRDSAINRKIIALDDPELPAKILAAELGINVGKLQDRRGRLASEGKIERPFNGRPISPENVDLYPQVEWLFDQGVPNAKIAKYLGQDLKKICNMVARIKIWQEWENQNPPTA